MDLTNKKGTNLITIIISIVLIIMLTTTILLSFNHSISEYKSTTIYNINQSLWKFRKNGRFSISKYCYYHKLFWSNYRIFFRF